MLDKNVADYILQKLATCPIVGNECYAMVQAVEALKLIVNPANVVPMRQPASQPLETVVDNTTKVATE